MDLSMIKYITKTLVARNLMRHLSRLVSGSYYPSAEMGPVRFHFLTPETTASGCFQR